MQKNRRFGETLDRTTLEACQKDAELTRVGEQHVVAVPQRAFRKPGRPVRGEPVLTRMPEVGHGGGDVRVRLYLWMWAIASTRPRPDLPIKRSTGEWAVLLNLLPGARANHREARALAARRVARAQEWLVSAKAARRGGRGEMVLLDPSCDGSPYRPWTEAELVERSARRSEYQAAWGNSYDQRRAGDYWEDDPLKVPVAVWTNGTVSALSGAALVALLVLLDLERRLDLYDKPILPPKSRPNDYPLSAHVWRRGTEELVAYGCIRRHQGPSVFGGRAGGDDSSRYRSMWRIDHRRLEGRDRERYG